MRYVFALFLLAHGLVHLLWVVPPPSETSGRPWPFTLDTSPVLSPFGTSPSTLVLIGRSLATVATVGFVLSALGAAGVPVLASAWAVVTICAAIVSIVVTGVFWNPQFPIGPLIDVALIVTALGHLWPATLVVVR